MLRALINYLHTWLLCLSALTDSAGIHSTTESNVNDLRLLRS